MANALPASVVPHPTLFMHDVTRPGVQLVLAQPWFQAAAQDVQARIVECVYTLQASKGEVVLAAGAAVEGWYAVLSGLVKLQTTIFEGRRQAYLGIPGGEWFGEGSVMKSTPRPYEVVALRDCELLCLPRTMFEQLYATSLPFVQAVARHLNMRLGQAMLIIETMRLRSPEQRVAMYLGPALWHGSRRLALSQEELGILSGLSRQTVNAVLNEFERRQLVSLDFGRIDIRDEAGLVALAFPRP